MLGLGIPVLCLALAGSVLLTGGGSSSAVGDRPSAVTSTGPGGSTSAAPSTPARTVPAPPAARATTGRTDVPATLLLPGGTRVGVRPIGTRRDGELDVPGDIRVAGWWRGGSRIGDPFGAMVLAAHVDSTTQGLGAYAVLLTVQRGARVVVAGPRLTETYAVTERRIVARDRLRSVPDVFSPAGPRRLVLITCAGPYLPSRGGYQNLAVVTADPVSDPTPTRG